MENTARKVEKQTTPLRAYMKSAGHPVLCIGPMSVLCVDAVVSFANSIRKPIPLIASRRQIEARELGGGYVNNWSTESFSEYVRLRDSGGFTPLCRDHGGPWQGANEDSLSAEEAMGRAKLSIKADLEAGFSVIHIDPSLRSTSLLDRETLNQIFELYHFTQTLAAKLGKEVDIEVGAEQQSGHYSDPRELVQFLKAISKFCESHSYARPLFCVVQTGTLVKEMRNVGLTEGRKNESLDQKYAVETMEKSVKHLAEIAYINGVFVKEHNADYLSDGSLALRNRLEVGGVNIAPELGLLESKSLVILCNQLGLKKELNEMLELFFSSGKWEKWLRIDSDATDFEKAIIAGHYCFADQKFQSLLEKIREAGTKQNVDLDQFVKTNLTALLQRLAWNLGYFNA